MKSSRKSKVVAMIHQGKVVALIYKKEGDSWWSIELKGEGTFAGAYQLGATKLAAVRMANARNITPVAFKELAKIP